MLLILWMGFIFYMSSQPQEQSAETSGLVTEMIYRMINFFFESPISLHEFLNSYGRLIRKLAHITEFMILGILAVSNYREYMHDHNIIIPFAFSAIYALSDEFHQLFTQGRFCSLGDILIDSCGALCGILLYYLLIDRWIRKQHF